MDTGEQIPPSLPLPSGSETALGRRQKGGAAVQSRITHFKPGIGTLAPDGITPLWQRGARPVEWGILLHRARGDFLNNMSTQLWTP
jgi:hypothetical protein